MRSDLIRKADQLFRLYMKRKWGAPEPIQCAMCHSYFRADLIDIGHIFSRNFLATRWCVENVVPQCVECNRNKSGENSLCVISPEVATRLRFLAHDKNFRCDEEFLQSIISRYE